jgi:predicted mannosyl-3-phosphoglycerate phosphatase (HAD superfamily)
VRFHSHIHPSIAPTAGRQLTEEEEEGLVAAVEKHGSQNWRMVAEETGLAWPPWRLLQAYRRVQTRNVTTEGFDTSRDPELLTVVKRLVIVGATCRQVSWLVRHLPLKCIGS